MAKRTLPWERAIIEVLREADSPMHFSEIAEEISKQKLRKSVGATPANTVASYISKSLSSGQDIFVRTDRGYYALRENIETKEIESTSENDEEAAGIVTSIGMYWRLSEVEWKSNPKILGRQQENSDAIDFSGQQGVYLLHDRGRVIYVGRSIDRPLGQRLFEHTRDRLNGRWERFSWFGLRKVNASGKLEDPEVTFDAEQIVTAFEAILIESLEPPQNRRRGDHFAAVEYLQVPRPVDDTAMKAAIIQDLFKKEFSA